MKYTYFVALVSENGETTKRMDIVNIHLAETVPENNNPGQ